MSKEDYIYQGQKIKFKGVLDIARMYTKIKEWLEEEDFKIKEDMYIERVKPTGKDIEIVWTATQEKNKYIKWKSKITFYIIGVTDREVEQEGKKLKLQSCTTEVKFEAWLITNQSDGYNEESIIKKFYEKYIIGDKIEEEKTLLFKSMQDLVSEFKTFLALYQA